LIVRAPVTKLGNGFALPNRSRHEHPQATRKKMRSTIEMLRSFEKDLQCQT